MPSVNKSSETLKPANPFAVLGPYLVVLASAAAVVGLTAAAHAAGWPIPIGLPLLVPVFLGACLGGFGAGLFAMALGLAADHFLFGASAFDIQRLFPHANARVRFVFFMTEGLLLIGIGHWYRLSRQKARESLRRRQMLEQEIVRRRKLEELLVRSQRAVKSQLAEIESIYATAPVGLCFLDRDLRFVRINRRLAEIHGASVEAHLGRSVQEAVPEIGPAIVPHLRRAIVSGEPILEKEIAETRPNGSRSERILLASFFPIKESDGFVSGVNVAVQDIAGQKRFEVALRDSEARLQLALEMGRTAVWEHDPSTGGVTWFDPAQVRPAVDFEDRFLAWLQEISAQDLSALPEPEDRSVPSHRREFCVALPDGRSNWVEVRGRRMLGDSGHCPRLAGALVDVTDRKRAEEGQIRAERLYRAVGESIEYGLWVGTPEGSLAYASESFLALTGLTLDRCSDFGWLAAVHPDDAPRVSESWRLAVRTLQPWDSEYRCRGTDGRWHPIRARGVPVEDLDGSVMCWAGVHLDIGRLKEAEDALCEAERRKDEFVALLAHELRNFLAPILTSAQLLKRCGSERPELLESTAGSIERQVKSLTRLINDLLDVSRLARGKLKLNFEVADMASAIAQAVEVCRPVIEKNRQELALLGTGRQLCLWGDSARLSQIVANLLMNAAKFTPASGRIELAMNRVGKDISVTVRDNGIGIGPDALEHIFEPFARFERPLHNAPGGLGVGLALVKSLVEMHGGTVSAASPGKDRGSEFSIRLPLYDPASGRPMAGEGEARPLRSSVPRDIVSPAHVLEG